MRIIFEFEDSEVEKNQHFFNELYELLKNAQVKPESTKKPEITKKPEFPDVVTEDTPMLSLGISSEKLIERIKDYEELKNCNEDGILTLGQFVRLKTYQDFVIVGNYYESFNSNREIAELTFVLKRALKKLWIPGMEIPISALELNAFNRRRGRSEYAIFKDAIGGDVFKDPDFDWSVFYKSRPNLKSIRFLCVLIRYIFSRT